MRITIIKSGQEEVNQTSKNKKPISTLDMALFLYLLEQPNYSGYNFKQYINSIVKYNTEQIYKQAIISIQQQKELKIDFDEFRNTIRRQQNSRLNIHDNKISGFMDMQMIGINNYSKMQGIIEAVRKQLGKTKEQFKKLLDKGKDIDIKVRFISVEDDKTTPMCESLNEQIFSVNKINTFTRYYGNTAKELKKKRFRVKGLVLRYQHATYCSTFSLL